MKSGIGYRICYVHPVNGTLHSIYDNSKWNVGKERYVYDMQIFRGLFCYREKYQAINGLCDWCFIDNTNKGYQYSNTVGFALCKVEYKNVVDVGGYGKIEAKRMKIIEVCGIYKREYRYLGTIVKEIPVSKMNQAQIHAYISDC